jgi:hypothetical protein
MKLSLAVLKIWPKGSEGNHENVRRTGPPQASNIFNARQSFNPIQFIFSYDIHAISILMSSSYKKKLRLSKQSFLSAYLIKHYAIKACGGVDV